MIGKVADQLENNSLRDGLVHHPFFRDIKRVPQLTHRSVSTFVGQWWHPLHYFPSFLSRTIDVLPMLEMKTAISKILYQELGEGNPARAHEQLYITTMSDVGFDRSEIDGMEPTEETRRLIVGYRNSTIDSISALGFVYGTEVADLAMVGGIGNAVRRLTGAKSLPWVDIHVEQEPDHVDQVNEAIEPSFTAAEEERIVASAEEMWRLWINFFDRLHAVMLQESEAAQAA